MTITLLCVLAGVLWGTVFWPVYLVMMAFFVGQSHASLKASIIAAFWPITVPLGLLLLMVLGKWWL